jgi:methyl-accepting chemotaxis protein
MKTNEQNPTGLDIDAFLIAYMQALIQESNIFVPFVDGVKTVEGLPVLFDFAGGLEGVVTNRFARDFGYQITNNAVLVVILLYLDETSRVYTRDIQIVFNDLDEQGKSVKSISGNLTNLSNVVSNIRSKLNDFIDKGFADKIDDVKSDLTNVINGIQQPILDKIDDVKSDLTNVINGIQQPILSKIDESITAINDKTYSFLFGEPNGVLYLIRELLEQSNQDLFKEISDYWTTLFGGYYSDFKEYLDKTLDGKFANFFKNLKDYFEIQSIIYWKQLGGILEEYDENLRKFLRQGRDQFYNDLPKLIQNAIKELNDKIINFIDITWVKFIDDFSQFKTSMDDLKTKISRFIVNFDAFSMEVISAFEGLGFALDIIISETSAVAATVISALGALIGNVEAVLGVASKVLENTESILTAIGKLPDAIFDKIEKRFEEIEKKLADEVALRVVGESYYKWDSVNTYYPTITFIYIEPNTTGRRKKVQIRAKLGLKSEDITESFLTELKNKILQLAVKDYVYGIIKLNYVHNAKRFKTTLNVSNKSQGVDILKNILSIIGEQLNLDDISYTEGKQRPSITRRSTPLGEYKTQQDNYNMEFPLTLFRTFILINGLESPIQVYP